MKTRDYGTGLGVVALMVVSAIGALAQTEPQHGQQTPVPEDMSMMDMDPYFSTVNYPVPQDTMMVMLLSDFQSGRSTNDFLTGMGMVQYGLTSRWTVGFMVEGQKISGLPATYGGLRISTYFRVFPHDHLLQFTLYGEYEGLNGAALYKMEVAGFGGGDLNEPLAQARRTPVRTLELRAITYHDWGRVNLTFNFVNETGLESGENDFGYALGVFRRAAYRGRETDKDMAGMPGMPREKAPAAFSFQRLGYGLEMMGALGNATHFGFDWQRQQQYVGPVFSYSVSKHWTVHIEPIFGLSPVSDPFVLRMGIGYSIDDLLHRRPATRRAGFIGRDEFLGLRIAGTDREGLPPLRSRVRDAQRAEGRPVAHRGARPPLRSLTGDHDVVRRLRPHGPGSRGRAESLLRGTSSDSR